MIFASKIRIYPYSQYDRTVCLRVEIFGCPWEGNYLYKKYYTNIILLLLFVQKIQNNSITHTMYNVKSIHIVTRKGRRILICIEISNLIFRTSMIIYLSLVLSNNQSTELEYIGKKAKGIGKTMDGRAAGYGADFQEKSTISLCKQYNGENFEDGGSENGPDQRVVSPWEDTISISSYYFWTIQRTCEMCKWRTLPTNSTYDQNLLYCRKQKQTNIVKH